MDGDAAPVDDEAVPVGTVIDGEYRVDGLLGQGGMGVVHRAFDVRLERAVAVKVHRGRGLALERLAREATALARLAHPNVVAVHRVGTHAGRVYVAMELVEGGTARAWAQTPRQWREVLALYRAAGDGLVAAHAAGLVHRDFKPDNVLVGLDGRARVADFGLARAADEGADVPATPVPARSEEVAATAGATETAGTGTATGAAGAYLANAPGDRLSDRPAFDRTLTRTGGRVGTPAYMAPEQLDGAAVDARADQFALAVSIWEALHGHRPFRGETTSEIRAAMARHAIDPRRRAGVPGWIDDVLGRALREAPAERWPDVAALLAALRDPRRTAGRRRRVVVVAALVLLVAGAAVLSMRVRSRPSHGARAPVIGATRRITSMAERKQDPIYVDEHTLAFVANDPTSGQYDLWLVDRDGDDRRRLTDTPEDDYLPRPWPGGGFVVSRLDGAHGSVWRVARDGTAEPLVDDALYASPSPAGDAIAFLRSRGLSDGASSLWTRDLRTGQERERLALAGAGVATAWSPDGRTIAVADHHQIWLVDVATNGARRLGEPATDLRSLSWDPRGRGLVADGAWRGRSTVWWLPTGGAPERLGTRDNVYHPTIAPDGKSLLFVDEDKRTFLVRGGDKEPPATVPGATSIDCIDVDRAGQRVGATDWEAGHGSDASAVIQSLDDGKRIVLGAGRCPRFSPDGARVAWLADGTDARVWVASATGDVAPRALDGVTAAAIPAWMPDGTLAIAGAVAGEAGLWLVDPERATPPRRVTATELTSLAPSPDGRTIAASVDDATILVDVASGEVRRLSRHHAVEAPAMWSHDGTTLEILVDERRAPALLTVALDGTEGARRPVPILTDPGMWGVFWVRKLPDGRLLSLQIRYDNDLYEAPLVR